MVKIIIIIIVALVLFFVGFGLGKFDVDTPTVVVPIVIILVLFFGGRYLIHRFNPDLFSKFSNKSQSEINETTPEENEETPFLALTNYYFQSNADNYFGLSRNAISAATMISFDNTSADYTDGSSYYYYLGKKSGIINNKVILSQDLPVTLQVEFDSNDKLKRVRYMIGEYSDMGVLCPFSDAQMKNLHNNVTAQMKGFFPQKGTTEQPTLLWDANKKCAIYSSTAEYDGFSNSYAFGNTLYVEFWIAS